jgi:hypothetical protein
VLKALLEKIPKKKSALGLEVLIISQEILPESRLVGQLEDLKCPVRCYETVENFLDSYSIISHCLVLIDVDIFDPRALDDIAKLRMYFGEGPATKIIAMTSFSPGSFDQLLENAGCDISVKKTNGFTEVLSILATRLKADQ